MILACQAQVIPGAITLRSDARMLVPMAAPIWGRALVHPLAIPTHTVAINSHPMVINRAVIPTLHTAPIARSFIWK